MDTISSFSIPGESPCSTNSYKAYIMATAQFACKDQPGEGLSGPSDSPSTKVLLAVKMQSLWMKIGSEWEVQPDLPGKSLMV